MAPSASPAEPPPPPAEPPPPPPPAVCVCSSVDDGDDAIAEERAHAWDARVVVHERQAQPAGVAPAAGGRGVHIVEVQQRLWRTRSVE